MRRVAGHARGAVGHGCVNHRHSVDGRDGLPVTLTAEASITRDMCSATLVTAAAFARFKGWMLIALQHGHPPGSRCMRIVARHAVAARGFDSRYNVNRTPALRLCIVAGPAQL